MRDDDFECVHSLERAKLVPCEQRQARAVVGDGLVQPSECLQPWQYGDGGSGGEGPGQSRAVALAGHPHSHLLEAGQLVVQLDDLDGVAGLEVQLGQSERASRRCTGVSFGGGLADSCGRMRRFAPPTSMARR